MQRNVRARIYVSVIGVALIIPAMFGVGNSTAVAASVVFLAVFGIGWGFFDCNNMPILCQLAPRELRATGYGIMNFVSIACGGFADWGFGLLRDRQVSLQFIFTIFSGVALASIALALMIRPQRTLNE